MDYSTTYAVDNTAEVAVTAKADGVKRIVVQENYNSANPPTADLLQRGRITGSAQIRIPKGTPAIFTCPNEGGYNYGQQAGTIETAGGSITVQESQLSRI